MPVSLSLNKPLNTRKSAIAEYSASTVSKEPDCLMAC
jgi:hypothetical protein